MNYYPHHIGDYRSATAHLTNEQDLAYRRLLEMYYDTEKPIPEDTEDVSRRLRVDHSAMKVVLKDFFFNVKGAYRHVRCELEIKDYLEKAEKARQNGKKGGRRKAAPVLDENPAGSQSVSDGLADGTQALANHEPLTISQEPKKRPKGLSSAAKLPTCPYDAIVELYHTILPSDRFPGVRVMDPSRKKIIRECWEWVLSSKKADGTARAQTVDQALAWFTEFFTRVLDNDFLMGRTQRAEGHKNWKPDIEYLLKPAGIKQVIEKTSDGGK